MIPEKNPYNNWSGNGTTTTFDFDFYIEDETQLVVYHTNTQGVQTTLTRGTDYTINETQNEDGSFITFPIAGSTYSVLGSGEIISLCLTLPISQENEYGKSSSLNLKAMEYSLDYLTRICQIINRQMERSVKTQEGSSQSADQLIAALQQAQVNAAASATAAAASKTDAQGYATTASEEATIATQKAAEVSETYTTAMSDISSSRQTAINDIETAQAAAESAIQADKEEAAGIIATGKSELNTQISTGRSNISSDISTGRSEISSDITTGRSNITSDITTGRSNISSDISTGRSNISTDISNGITTLEEKAEQLGEQYLQKANIIWYADRDFEYKQPDFIKADKSNVVIKAGTAIRLKNGEHYYTATDATYTIGNIIDTGSVTAGRDYYFYLNNSGNIIASLNETAPANYTANDVVKIGGAHTLCVGVTSNNAPALLSDSFWTTHPAIGYNAGNFIPNSSWTQAFKSEAKTGNKGMVLIDHAGMEKFWVDIYLQSGTGKTTASSYTGTITNSRQPILHQWDMNLVGKKLPTDSQFTIFAEGSNNKTNISGSAIPSGKLTGGYSDTAGKRMISGFFVECCCGYLWQWGDEIGFNGNTNWSSYGVDNRGQTYGMPYVLLFGGKYADSSYCGSWARGCAAARSLVSASSGARGVSLHIEKPHS